MLSCLDYKQRLAYMKQIVSGPNNSRLAYNYEKSQSINLRLADTMICLDQWNKTCQHKDMYRPINQDSPTWW